MANTYADESELQARFEDSAEVAQLTDSTDGTPDTTVTQELVDRAAGIFDSYVGKIYAIPVDVSVDDTLDATVRNIVLDIAVYLLLVRGENVPAAKLKAYDDAIAWLVLISNGEVVLPSAEVLASTTTRFDGSQYGTAGTSDSSNRLFSRATQENL